MYMGETIYASSSSNRPEAIGCVRVNQPFKNISQAIEAVPTYRCPCCHCKTLYGRAQDEICRVCYWHDDGQDEHDADLVRGGPNGLLSLRQAQANFSRYGASDQRFVFNVRTALPSER
jgi:Cysteine-rich CPCC